MLGCKGLIKKVPVITFITDHNLRRDSSTTYLFLALRHFLTHCLLVKVIFEGEHSGISPHGDITIDDISFTPECRAAPHGTAK